MMSALITKSKSENAGGTDAKRNGGGTSATIFYARNYCVHVISVLQTGSEKLHDVVFQSMLSEPPPFPIQKNQAGAKEKTRFLKFHLACCHSIVQDSTLEYITT